MVSYMRWSLIRGKIIMMCKDRAKEMRQFIRIFKYVSPSVRIFLMKFNGLHMRINLENTKVDANLDLSVVVSTKVHPVIYMQIILKKINWWHLRLTNNIFTIQGHFLQTQVSSSSFEFATWISDYIHITLQDAINYSCLDFNGGSTKPQW